MYNNFTLIKMGNKHSTFNNWFKNGYIDVINEGTFWTVSCNTPKHYEYRGYGWSFEEAWKNNSKITKLEYSVPPIFVMNQLIELEKKLAKMSGVETTKIWLRFRKDFYDDDMYEFISCLVKHEHGSEIEYNKSYLGSLFDKCNFYESLEKRKDDIKTWMEDY